MQANWSYPTTIWFGAGRIDGLPDACRSAGMERPLLVTDRGLADLPITARALDILEKDQGPGVDLFFMDCLKEQYPLALDGMLRRLCPGGAIVVDNMLWYGRPVARHTDPSLHDEPETRGVEELTRKLFAHPSLWTTIIPLRDGLSLSIHKGS